MGAQPQPVTFGPYVFIWDGRGYIPDPATWPDHGDPVRPEVELLRKAVDRA
jgi:hypothetical protein